MISVPFSSVRSEPQASAPKRRRTHNAASRWNLLSEAWSAVRTPASFPSERPRPPPAPRRLRSRATPPARPSLHWEAPMRTVCSTSRLSRWIGARWSQRRRGRGRRTRPPQVSGCLTMRWSAPPPPTSCGAPTLRRPAAPRGPAVPVRP